VDESHCGKRYTMIFDIAGESKEIISTFGSPIYYRKNSSIFPSMD